MSDGFQQVTITCQQHPHLNGEKMYCIQVDGTPENLWTKPGWYETLDEAFAAFDFSLRADVQATVREAFEDTDTVTFSLKGAF